MCQIYIFKEQYYFFEKKKKKVNSTKALMLSKYNDTIIVFSTFNYLDLNTNYNIQN
jgi:hypothetical protein